MILLLFTLFNMLFSQQLLAAQSPAKAEKFEIEKIIPPEIKNDEFYLAIHNLARSEKIGTILEIGSSSGDGSTEAFVRGIVKNSCRPVLFCMEVSQPRYRALKRRYGNVPGVKCYNVSSVPLTDFPSENDVIEFYQSIGRPLEASFVPVIFGWLKQDIDYIRYSNVNQNGIELIKAENGIKDFDIVLIDGSEFTGMAEFKLVYGARWILLDDINTFKNYNNHQKLLNDSNYRLVKENRNLRNGYSIFKRK